MNDDRAGLEPIETCGDGFKVVNASQIPLLVSVLRITHAAIAIAIATALKKRPRSATKQRAGSCALLSR